MTYRTRQVEVDAHQLVPGLNEMTMKWCRGVATNSLIEGPRFHLPLTRSAKVGEWIVRHGDVFFVFSDAEFKERYEVVPEGKPLKPVPAAEVKSSATS